MSDHATTVPAKRIPTRWIAFILTSLTLPTLLLAARCMMPQEKPPMPAGTGTVGGVPLFASWPKDAQPEVAIVSTGQTYGFLSPCGCSRPQKGGLERRANFIKMLRDKGWPVAALDLGDMTPMKFDPNKPTQTPRVPEQDRLKYEYMMKALAEMGYSAVGVGIQEFDHQLWHLLSMYTLQKPNEAPFVLAANLGTLDPAGAFLPPAKSFSVPNARPMIDSYEVVNQDKKAQGGAKNHVGLGVVGLIGPSVEEKLKTVDKTFAVGKIDDTLPGVLAAMKTDAKKPLINVLLYSGSKDETAKLAEKYPDFNLIVCTSEESLPPQYPMLVNNNRTFVVQVGHKGQNVGVVGVFKTAQGYELKYQLVELGEEYLTPKGDEAAKANTVLQLLEQYTAKVKKDNLLAKHTEKPQLHEAQITNPKENLTFVGSESCQACHPNEYKIWKESKHSHAMEALEKYAERPSLRQFDGDCVQCHTVGFRYQSGYKNDTDTPKLRHVGCESCHGPGSGHVAAPNNKELLASLSKWKINPNAKLPSKEQLEKKAKFLEKPDANPDVKFEPAEQLVVNAVQTRCMSCHDQENDPKFDLYKYMPQIWHSGFKPAAANGGLPPGANK
jgi:2',3'-cyclic-nucleotide 2'-phosphodiesterase (5'-nucleotidase family)